MGFSFGFILNIFYKLLHRSEDSCNLPKEKDIISFALHIRITARNYSRMANRKFINFALSIFPLNSAKLNLSMFYMKPNLYFWERPDCSSLIFIGVKTFWFHVVEKNVT